MVSEMVIFKTIRFSYITF